MFVVGRKEVYELTIFNKHYVHTENHYKKFLDQDFVPILDYLDSKGLVLTIPSIIDGWDATFIYKKLTQTKLNKAAEQMALFLYMRLQRRNPVSIEHSGLFSI